MAIIFDAEKNIIKLDTARTTYMIGIQPSGFIGHIYYGKKVAHAGGTQLLRGAEIPSPDRLKREKLAFKSMYNHEYSTVGTGDFREGCLNVISPQGKPGCELIYDSFTIENGKPSIPGQPATFAGAEEVQTLKIVLKDVVLALKVTLLYSVFEAEDVITRSVIIENEGSEKLYIDRALSACLDMDNKNFEMLSMHGSWARERHIQTVPVGYGRQSMASNRGVSSPQEHPFIVLMTPGTTQKQGEVYAMNFVYSGNFLAQVERTQRDGIRMVMGIHPEGFGWNLEAGASFETPEVVMTYSAEGLGRMTRNLHDLYREHLIRSPWKDEMRPILVNNWEATYFDFDQDKIISLAKAAKAEGIEMIVMDDGWFGERNSDCLGLGDWYVNEKKLKGGLKYLGEQIHALGLKFGIWVEPEMVNENSDLFRAHPDWVIQLDNRVPSEHRQQLVLDCSRQEVRDAIMNQIIESLKAANVDYVKWDMNRYLSDVGSFALSAEQQPELMHRYVLGVYEMQQRLLDAFPELLLENCSSGGARFDPAMLYFSPQIWTSDDTDAIERLRIQEGTAICYPLSTMGAHVSKCPNHQVGRMTPFSTRGNVALAGTFGYELDIENLEEEERSQIRGQVDLYHRDHMLIAMGDYYRLHSWNDAEPYDCYMVAAKDGSAAVLTYVQVLGRPFTGGVVMYPEGLNADDLYVVEETGEEFYGDVLMNCGMLIPAMGDFESKLYHIVRK